MTSMVSCTVSASTLGNDSVAPSSLSTSSCPIDPLSDGANDHRSVSVSPLPSLLTASLPESLPLTSSLSTAMSSLALAETEPLSASTTTPYSTSLQTDMNTKSALNLGTFKLRDTAPSESVSDESVANTGKPSFGSGSHSQLRSGPFQKLSNIFKESDGRYEENLRSVKRRIVQVRRQPDSAPVRLQMGFRSRTGWEPIRASKENQDCLIALVPWGPGSRYNFFAALDGHGRHGHQCAMFIAQRVISYLSRALLALSTKQAIVNSLHKAIVYAERRLEKVSDVDYTLSGSTGVFVIIYGTTLYCANVGDSRAILGRTEVRKYRRGTADQFDTHMNCRDSTDRRRHSVVQISFDHKPRRLDEKERLLRCGARVDVWESIEDEDERIWLPDIRTPGLAVSRTFGDLILKPYGVVVTPEIYSLELCEHDRFIVMASDGVFEFMSNEDVAEIAGRWRDRGSAQDAAEELVRVATERWIDDDSVIDDISCVVVFMNVRSSDVDVGQIPVRMDPSFSEGSDHNYPEEDRNEPTGSGELLPAVAPANADCKETLPPKRSQFMTSVQGYGSEEFKHLDEDPLLNDHDEGYVDSDKDR